MRNSRLVIKMKKKITTKSLISLVIKIRKKITGKSRISRVIKIRRNMTMTAKIRGTNKVCAVFRTVFEN